MQVRVKLDGRQYRKFDLFERLQLARQAFNLLWCVSHQRGANNQCVLFSVVAIYTAHENECIN